ncbi:MAG: glycosyl hydrolase [Oscillospiraceae bacterium]
MIKIWKRITAVAASVACLAAAIPSMLTTAEESSKESSSSIQKIEIESGTLTTGKWKEDIIDPEELKKGVYCEKVDDEEASGGQYIKFNSQNFEISYDINVEETSYYTITVYSNSDAGNGQKKNNIEVNGEGYGEFASKEGDFAPSKVNDVKLNKGTNTLVIYSSWGYINADYFTVEKDPDTQKDYYSAVASNTLVNKNATANTKRLYQYLKDSYGKYTISGQQSDMGYNSYDVRSIKELTGEEPAIIGLDLMDFSRSSVVEHQKQSGAIEYAIDVADKGGIVALCWHWRMWDKYLKGSSVESEPCETTKEGGKGNPRWWGSFYNSNLDLTGEATTEYGKVIAPAKQKFDLAKIMNNPGSEEYKMLVDDIDYIAKQLKELQDKNIPVLFRPLHEGGGHGDGNTWFWWGSGGPEAYIKLYRLVYDRITNVNGINNLIWVWNGQDKDYYPGDEYVDIIGEDIYNSQNDFQPNKNKFIQANEYTTAPKIVALTENGTLMEPEKQFDINAKWSYFTSWTGEYSASGNFNDADNKSIWKKVYNSDKIITLSELPDLSTYPIPNDVPATSVKLDTTEAKLEIGDSIRLYEQLEPQNSTEIAVWTSSDENVATVENGKVTAKSIGTATITCKIANGKSATAKISVSPAKVSNLKAAAAANSVKLTWDKVEGADKYEVVVMDNNAKQISVSIADTNSYECKGLNPSTYYKFKVRAFTVVNDAKIYGDYSAIILTQTAEGKGNDSSQTTPKPTQINPSDKTNPTVIPSANTPTNITVNGNSSDNGVSTGVKALTTIGLGLAAAIVLITKKKK